MKLPEGLDATEVEALRKLARGLEADGYAVLELGVRPDGSPAALVAGGKVATPKRTILLAARSLLSAAERLGLHLQLEAGELETLSAARVTLREVQRRALVFNNSVGDAAHARFAEDAALAEDRRDALELRAGLRALVRTGAVSPGERVDALARKLDELLGDPGPVHPG